MLELFKTQGAERVNGLRPGKVVCVGRNYAEHARELDNPIPESPVLFMKPATSLVDFTAPFGIPSEDCHYEAEIAVVIVEPLSRVSAEEARSGIGGIALALDLTKRALQSELKQKSLPWELSKSFDGACPLTAVVGIDKFPDLQDINFSLAIDGELRQLGDSSEMLFPIAPLVSEISKHFTLMPGDIVLTGTPKGVGELTSGMTLELKLNGGFTSISRTL
jgi:2-keto-4-pentenoate hydratase/2-oxohepta-3-ene-1,7-dioic acid hydratase in catechol pathway